MVYYFLYSILAGLIFRRLEIAMIPSRLSDAYIYEPLIYLFYACFSLVLFLLAHLLVKNADTPRLKKIRARIALCVSILTMIWVSFVLNRNLEGIHGKTIEMTSDWFIIEVIESLITLPVLIIVIFILSLLIRFFTSSQKKGKGIPATLVFAWLLLIAVFTESVVYSDFIGKDLKFGKADLPNIILLSVDTVRKDHLSIYGYPRKTSSNLERFFSEGVIFERCISAVPETGPNYASIFTGVYPARHGVFANGQKLDFQDSKLPAIASRLRDVGYTTSSHLTAALPGSFSGLDYGVQDLYQHGVKVKSAGGYTIYDLFTNCVYAFKTFVIDRRQNQQSLNPETEYASKWLDHKPKEPFYTHIYWHWPHAPYGDRLIALSGDFMNENINTEPVADTTFASAKDIYEARMKYDSDLLYTDVQIGAIVHALERNDLLENSVVIFTSDHGEDLGQRLESGQPYYGHSKWLYESSTEVPLLIRLPGKSFEGGLRIEAPVSSTDIAPTIIELAGDAIPESMQGMAVVDHNGRIPAVLDTADRFAYSFNVELDFAPLHRDISGIFSKDWTFYMNHDTGLEELYNYRNDVHSIFNLIDDEPELADSLRSALSSWMGESNYSPAEIRKSSPGLEALSPAALKNLKTLGYVK